jgi:AAA domain (dynein-related subfamily)
MNNKIKDVVLYDWVLFFGELCDKINELYNNPDRDELLENKAKECFINTSICNYEFVDPFSFIYALAQRNTINQKTQYYIRVKESFGLSAEIPTDWDFPTPTPNALSLFHDGVNFETELLWNSFKSAIEDADIGNNDFLNILKITNVKIVKLTQTLFLINPKSFLPIDQRTMSLPIFDENMSTISRNIERGGYHSYINYLNDIQKKFEGCNFFEINHLAYLIDSGSLNITGDFYQIGSNVYSGKDDYIEEFYSKNIVRVGGPTSGGQGKKIYPVTEPEEGDIILSHLNHVGNGIGIVLYNEYKEYDGYDDDCVIKVLWLNKSKQKQSIKSTQNAGFSKAWGIKDSFKTKYPVTFSIIEKLIERSTVMEEINDDSIKNLILQGAPGTGKTRLAKQLAIYLQQPDSSLESFMNDEVLDSDIFKKDPELTDSEYIHVVQFHPGYSYEDFVRGIVTEVNAEGRINYRVQNRILMDIVKDAESNKSKKYVLIIDEMNRANLPSVLGELIYALEYRGEKVKGIYKDYETNNYEISIPNNLYIIGTMNTADRSIGHIDYAIRRRFVFKNVLSDSEIITDEEAKECFQNVEELFSHEYLSPDFNKDDVMIGHSYFLSGGRDFELRREYEIKPLLKEYVKDGILYGDEILEKIENL